MNVDEMNRAMIKNMKEKTGKELDEWLQILKASGVEKFRARIDYLKSEHGLTHGYANMIVLQARQAAEGGPMTGSDMVDAQYGGAKAALRPIYEALAAEISQFGEDIELAPKKAYVSLRGKKQFGLIQPSTRTRVDVGINLKGTVPTGRLEASGSFNSMVSHRVRLTELAQVDDELVGWLKAAYDRL
jgi:hypothetical protein